MLPVLRHSILRFTAAHELRQSLGEDALRAGRDPANGPAHPHPEPDRRAAPREVGDGAVVATVAAMCMTLAGGTACSPAGDGELEGDSLLGGGDLGETQPFEMGQERGKAQATTPKLRRQQPKWTAMIPMTHGSPPHQFRPDEVAAPVGWITAIWY